MKLVYYQPYKKRRNTACWYGEPPKNIFKHDTIKLKLPDNAIIYLTPDEATDFIRALSAGLHHFLVRDKSVQHIIKAKK